VTEERKPGVPWSAGFSEGRYRCPDCGDSFGTRTVREAPAPEAPRRVRLGWMLVRGHPDRPRRRLTKYLAGRRVQSPTVIAGRPPPPQRGADRLGRTDFQRVPWRCQAQIVRFW
jgi:hypothetical protein